MMEPFRMEEDPDGTSQQVAVIMTGKVYREAGLKYSKHPEVEGLLYDKLCSIGKHKLRDDVRKLALSIALSVPDKAFKPTVDWLDDFMRRFCLSKKMMGFHSSAMLKQKGYTQPKVNAETKLSMSQEDVFSFLGLNIDGDPSSNTDNSATPVTQMDKEVGNPATSGENCVDKESSESVSMLTNSGENTGEAKTVMEDNVNGTASTDISKESDVPGASKSTLNSVVDPSDKTAASEMDDESSEKGNMSEKLDEVPNTSQETLNVHETQKSNCEDGAENVVLLDDSDDIKEAQDVCVKENVESKIGKISIKKIEDLCDKGVEKKKKDGSNENTSEVEVSSGSSEEDEDASEEGDGTSAAESVEASGSEKDSAVSRQAAKYNEAEEINYSKAENKYYKKNIDALQKKLEGSVIKCTSCYEQVNHHIKSLVHTHPVLGVFICKKCRKYYGRGKFCKDKEGYDEYCRLCAEGGDLLCCEQEDCYNGFCKRCVKRTMGRAELKHVESTEGWACYVCDPAPLMELRALHRAILDNLRNSEEEDAALSRKDLKSKTLQNKFMGFKILQQLRSQKCTKTKTSNKLTKEVDETSKSDGNVDKKKEEKSQENKKKTKQTSAKIHEENEENKPSPILRNTMDKMLEMMSQCMDNVKTIESKWKKSNYSSEGTKRARHHVSKQLEAMKTNFETLVSDLLECPEEEVIQMTEKEHKETEQSGTEKEHKETEQSGKAPKRSKRLENKKQDGNSTEEQNSEDKSYQEENNISESCESPSKPDSFEKEAKLSGDEVIEGQANDPKSPVVEKVDMEVAPSGEFADSVNPEDDESQRSSKACLPSNDEDSLPDLMNVINDIISDPEESMDNESNATMTKSLDIDNDIPKLSEDVGKKRKREEKNLDNGIAADGTDEEVEKSKDKGESNSKSSRILRSKSSTDKPKLGSDSESDEKTEKTPQRTSQRFKRRKLSKDSDNDDTSESRNLNKKEKNKDNSKGKKKDDKDTNKLEKDQVQSDEISDTNKSEEVEADKQEENGNKNKGKNKKASSGNDASDMEADKGSGSDKETDTTVQKKKKASTQNNGASKRGKTEKEKKEKSSTDNNAGKRRKSRRGKTRRQSDQSEDDKCLGLVEGSDTSEEENTDEEIQRRREDHTEKTRDKKKKIERKRSSESEGKEEKMDTVNSKGKTTKVEKKEKAESEEEKESDECKEGSGSQEEKMKTEGNETPAIKTDDDADTKTIKLEKKDGIKKEECDAKVEGNEDFPPSDKESPEKEDEKKVSKKKKVQSTKTENQRAKAAILGSESDVEVDEKPKPRSKKKHIKRQRDSQSKRKSRKKLVLLTEEEQEELKGKQLNGKCHVRVKSLSSNIQKKLEVDEFIYTSDYPEFDDGCDADEEDSDKEFSKLMKFRCGKMKPRPKCKSLRRNSSDEETKKVSDEDKQDDANGEEADAGSKTEEGENTENKNSKKSSKKKEGLLDIDIDKDGEEENEEEEVDDIKKKTKGGGISLNEKMKKHILLSSEEEAEDEEEEDQGDSPEKEKEEEERERKKYDKKKEKEKAGKENEESSDEEVPPKVRKGYMNLNISTDEEEKEETNEEESEEEAKSAYEDDSDFEESPRKRRAFQISSSDSEGGTKKSRPDESSEEESEEEEEKPKSKRKRIRKMSSSSDGDDDDDDDDDDEKKDSPSKHKKIRKVIRDEDLLETTKNATQEEEERRKRIAERQKNYNQIFLIDVESDQKDMEKLVLDFDPETKSELVSVNEKLVKFLKPHQFKGIKFMWDATVESLEQLKSNAGGGCILAHCMGLGKTLQVITFCHTLLTNKSVSKEVQRIMVCCPVNTIFNWLAEFKNWLKGRLMTFDVIELASAKDLWGRAYRLDDWWKEGGICIIGYTMFRNLSNSKNKRYKGKMKEIFQKTLIDPGPDIIVCDEGHMLKNEKTALSIAINKIKTRRRIVLTGTPLQNNLKEYHCMIQFVKPNLLGTKKEFMNRFVNPIEQGQCVEAMPRDVRRMKRRAHILHNLLEGCVQRFDYSVLKPFLPPKFEYVISVQLSEIQIKLYQYYLDNLARGGPKRQGSGLFVDFGALSRVWTHPKVLELAVRRKAFDEDDEEDDLDGFICDDSTTSESSDDERPKKKKKGPKKKDDKSDEEENEEIVDEPEPPGPIPGLTESGKVRVDWWKKVLLDAVGDDFEENGFLDQIEHSGKLILLLNILKECCSIGDKVLLFSQSLLTLDMIEDFLQAIDEGDIELPKDDDSLPLPFKKWKRDRDYLRLDGSTSPDTRKTLCNIFNKASNDRCRLFLISTRAGGLGINLVGANRVIIFDSSWNPSHDTQSIFRVYRFGQKKPCYIYRFVAQGTMEEKIYSRQVTKMSTALRVVDEHQIKRYFKMEELAQLYEFTPSDVDIRETPIVPKDRLLAELLQKQKDWIVSYHEQDSLLENQTSEELNEDERKAAWEDYENEKKGFMVQQHPNSVMSVMGAPTTMNYPGGPTLSLSSFNFESVVNSIRAQNPNMTPLEICESVLLATKQIQKIHLNHYHRVQAMLYNLKNPMIAPEQRKLLPFGSHPEMLPLLEGQLRVLEDNIQRENQIISHIDKGIGQQNNLLSTASLMSAGLIRGQPQSSGINSATTSYVERPSTSSVGGPSHQEKKTASNDVILLD
ncbi:transcriptional regulator ATRX-like isoform X2 [Eriocheir sinensis]|uniref:transcriptional regulator ATRX-like isoform X2 n=1 Tax=Eriocheir sinensis TaxID=95602 RepID=UPI0021C6C326|nr:transcriptional regulator ATRX-like isoform X2 [Eriocheir sinensis]